MTPSALAVIHSPSMRPWRERGAVNWVDLLFLLFLVGLAFLPPRDETHKQVILVAIGVFQLLEGWVVRKLPERGRIYCVLMKIVLATLLLDHTGGELSINSSYYPIYYVPVMTAAMYFGPVATLAWITLAAAAYSSFLYPALQSYVLTADSYAELSMRIIFFYLVGMLVNRFVTAYQIQTQRYREVAEGLEVANRNLKQAQAEARRSERLAALGQLSAGLAHEIRNPLGVIKGSAEMLNRKLATADPLSSELAGYVYTEVNRLSALVSRFLDFARPARLDLRPQDVRVLLDRALVIAFEQPAAKDVKLEKDYAPNLPEALVDEQFSEQVFINLAQNACEAMEEMQPEQRWLRVSAHSLDKDALNKDGANGVLVVFEDAGPGVPAELREQIFNPFVTTKKTGVGLGLSIVSKIMDDQGGSIRLAASEGKGARFELFFPASAPAGSQPSEGAQQNSARQV